VRQAYKDKEAAGEMVDFVKAQLKDLLTAPSQGIAFQLSGPTVVMVAGVNGAGKTTSIAKLAKHCQDQGKKVMVAACDTFRAAAVEQLTIWTQRLGCEIVKNQQGSDPASVAHDACEKARARNFDVLIVDTAGRLHTQGHLMKELDKIRRIVTKQIPGAPHEVLLVLDANQGQNAIAQAESFKKTIDCTGIILAKLDGTAKGGAIFAIKQKLNLPVKFVGMGEQLDDLALFDPDEYVAKLFDE
jgi:fused signal recognition particle receptor